MIRDSNGLSAGKHKNNLILFGKVEKKTKLILILRSTQCMYTRIKDRTLWQQQHDPWIVDCKGVLEDICWGKSFHTKKPSRIPNTVPHGMHVPVEPESESAIAPTLDIATADC